MTKYSNRIMADYLRDPRLTAAQRLQQEGTSSAPVSSPWQGLARMGQAALGAYQAGNVMNEYDARQKNYSTDLQALANEVRNAQDPAKAAFDFASRSQNPDMADMAGDYLPMMVQGARDDKRYAQQEAADQRRFEQQMRMAQETANRSADAQNAILNRQLALEQWKMQNDPQRALVPAPTNYNDTVFAKELAKKDADRIDAARAALEKSQNMADTLGVAQKQLENIPDIALGPVAGRISSLVGYGPVKNLESTQNALTLQAKELLGMPSANFSDADRDFLAAIAGGVNIRKEDLQDINAKMTSLLERQQARQRSLLDYGIKNNGLRGYMPSNAAPSAGNSNSNARFLGFE